MYGKKHGLHTQFYADGAKKHEIHYLGGQMHGRETKFHQDGKKKKEKHYLMGKRHGTQTRWFYKSTQKKRECNWETDEPLVHLGPGVT